MFSLGWLRHKTNDTINLKYFTMKVDEIWKTKRREYLQYN